MDKTCERCGEVPAAKNERYCKECRKIVLTELRSAGYLTPAPHYTGAWGGHRGGDARENTNETKHGTGH